MAVINGIQIDHFPLLGKTNKEYASLDLSITGDHYKGNKDNWASELVKMGASDKFIPYGGYLENRFFYTNKDLYSSAESRRDIHLGVDLWVEEGTDIYCPYDASVHSMAYNHKDLDYGYTIILHHQIHQFSFYSLYGHLSDSHVISLKVNDYVAKGSAFCKVGNQDQNGNWPPHLHFQLILDIGDYQGDYVGVCNRSELEFYKSNCPDGSSFIF